MEAGTVVPLVCVYCDIDLMRRGIERAATRAGLGITDRAADAALVVRDTTTATDGADPSVGLIVGDGAVRIAVDQPVEADLWAAVGRFANEVLGQTSS